MSENNTPDAERIHTNLSMRSSEIFDPEKQSMSIAIIGAGSIGSNVALLLARLGLTDISIYDFDEVEDHNLGHQAFRVKDIGVKKVDAIAEIVKDATGTEIQVHDIETNGNDIEADILILAVDSMEYRRIIHQNATYLYCLDCRMAGEEIQVYGFSAIDKDEYKETLFPDEEAIDLPCGGRAIGYISYIASGLLVNVATNMMTGAEFPFEQNFCSKTLTYYASKNDDTTEQPV